MFFLASPGIKKTNKQKTQTKKLKVWKSNSRKGVNGKHGVVTLPDVIYPAVWHARCRLKSVNPCCQDPAARRPNPPGRSAQSCVLPQPGSDCRVRHPQGDFVRWGGLKASCFRGLVLTINGEDGAEMCSFQSKLKKKQTTRKPKPLP